MFKVKLRNIKGIAEMDFPFPERKGVYVLTGANGSGKTSLLIALCRLGDKMAFTHFRVNVNKPGGLQIDAYNNSSITYCTGTEEVKYQRKGIRWVPNPRSRSNLIALFPFTNTLFVSTAGIRFFSQDSLNVKRPTFNTVNPNIINAMNHILGTEKFNNLKFITVKNKRGRQQQLHRSNKLYVIKDPSNNYYSEQNFSLGEKLLLNTLDLLENIAPKTLLLIDEVELALHPIAQIKFYDFLKQQADEKNLAVVISTHSSSLIKHADNRLFLEKDCNGIVSVQENCYPSYILRSVAAIEDRRPDFIFLVEDNMAFEYLQLIMQKFINDIHSFLDYKIIPAGTYDQVIRITQSFPALSIEKRKVQAFLDKDAEDAYNELEAKGNNRTEAENKKFDLFKNNHKNISYLSITPELGVWQWLENNPEIFKTFFDQSFGVQSFDMRNIIEQTKTEEEANKSGNLRHWAKGCFKNFVEKVNNENPTINNDNIIRCMLKCYVENNYDLKSLKSKLCPILHR